MKLLELFNKEPTQIILSDAKLLGSIHIIDHVQKYTNDQIVCNIYSKENKKYFNSCVLNNQEIEVVPEDKELYREYIEAMLKYNGGTLYHYFMIGSDPEMFVVDENGVVIPSFTFLGSKASPNYQENTPIYWDGFQGEFAPPARNCLEEHSWQIKNGLVGMIKAARAKNPKAVLSSKTTVDIPVEMLESAKEEHVQFGCMPSFNVYGSEGIKLHGREVPFRSAGGHLHFGIGTKNKNQDTVNRIVKALDAILGVASVSLFATMDDPKRRLMYGLAGEYRLPPHGLEYRVLSNAWLCHPMIMYVTVDLARKIVVIGENKMLGMWEHNEEETIRIINECDVKAAREVLKKNEKAFKQVCKMAYTYSTEAELNALFNMYMNGVESVIKDVNAVEKNWSDTASRRWVNSKSIVVNGGKVG